MLREAPSLNCCPICGQNGAESWLEAPDRWHRRQQLHQLISCSSCSLVWVRNPPSPGEMNHHYGTDYHRLVNRAGESSPIRWRKYAENLKQYKRAGALLDLGCSSGAFLASLKSQPWKLSGIEISSSSARKARATTGAEVFVGDILAAPFPPGSFDVVTCFDVLEHVHQPREVVEKVWEWLKPDGIFYVVLPNILSWEARIFRSYWFGLELPRHLFHFSPESLRRLLESVGFRGEWLVTPRICYADYSTRYVYDAILGKLGFSCSALANGTVPRLPWRVIRKCLRLSVLSLFSGAASRAGRGPSIESIFRKAPRQQSSCSCEQEFQV